MFNKYRDLFLGVFLLIVTGCYYCGTFFEKKFSLAAYGGEFVPRIYCLLVAFLAIGIIAEGLLKLKNERKKMRTSDGGFFKSRTGGIKIVVSMLLLILIVLVIKKIGFCISIATYLFLQVLLVIPKDKKNIWKIALFAVCFTVIVDFLFVRVFYVPLPSGLIGF